MRAGPQRKPLLLGALLLAAFAINVDTGARWRERSRTPPRTRSSTGSPWRVWSRACICEAIVTLSSIMAPKATESPATRATRSDATSGTVVRSP